MICYLIFYLGGGGCRVFFFRKINVEIIIDPTPLLVYQAFLSNVGILGHIGVAGSWGQF